MENNNEFLKRIGKRIKIARITNDMTLEKLMEITGYHRTTISKIERGRKDARILTIKSIADVFKIEVKDFL